MSKVELKLDTNAVRALFPEGTEAYLSLQQAVIANIAQGVVKNYAEDCTSLVNQVIQQEITKFESSLTHYTAGYRLQLHPKIKAEIESTVKEQGKTIVEHEINTALENYRIELDEDIRRLRHISASAQHAIEQIQPKLQAKIEAMQKLLG